MKIDHELAKQKNGQRI